MSDSYHWQNRLDLLYCTKDQIVPSNLDQQNQGPLWDNLLLVHYLVPLSLSSRKFLVNDKFNIGTINLLSIQCLYVYSYTGPCNIRKKGIKNGKTWVILKKVFEPIIYYPTYMFGLFEQREGKINDFKLLIINYI